MSIECVESAYFRSAFSESDNKGNSEEGLGARLLFSTFTSFKPMTIRSKMLKSIEKSLGLNQIYIKISL